MTARFDRAASAVARASRLCRCPFAGLLMAMLLTGWLGVASSRAEEDLASAECHDPGQRATPCPIIVFDGDSISVGMGSSPAASLDRQFLGALKLPARIRNVAAGGRPVHECVRLFATAVAPLFVPGAATDLIMFHAGDNDIAQHKSADETYAAFGRYVAEAHAQGWKVLVSTELQRVDFRPEQQAELAAYNKLVLANSGGADAVVDVDSDSRFADLSRRTDPEVFSKDRVHPSDGGYAVLARLLATAARPLLAF